VFEAEGSAIFYGLLSAASFGTADFSGGAATRKGSVFVVVLISQCVGITVLAVVALLLGEPIPSSRTMGLGSAAGIAGAVGLLSLYSGLAGGRMGVVAPLVAITTGILPLGVSLMLEGAPGTLQIAGFGLALAAVMLITRAGTARSIEKSELGLSLLAGLGFGLFFTFIDQAGKEAIFWPLVSARATSVTLLIAAVALLRRRRRPANGALWIIALAGLFDAAGNAFFAMAARAGRLDIATMLTSLYPAVTVMLAWLIFKEKIGAQQRVGVLLALTALYFIAS
jgi:drug/metabolite transporter (DMT)-like permease